MKQLYTKSSTEELKLQKAVNFYNKNCLFSRNNFFCNCQRWKSGTKKIAFEKEKEKRGKFFS